MNEESNRIESRYKVAFTTLANAIKTGRVRIGSVPASVEELQFMQCRREREDYYNHGYKVK